MPAFTIGVNDTPFTKLKDQVKASAKDVADLQKLIDKARKDGKQVADEVVKQLGVAEAKLSRQKDVLQKDGPRLRYLEQTGQRVANNQTNFNIRGMFQDQIEGKVDAIGQKPGALNTLLRSRGINAVTGGAGSAAANGAGSVAGAFGSAVAAYAGPIAVLAGVAKGFQEGMSIFHGYSDEYRKSRGDFAVRMADSSNPGIRRELDMMHMKREDYANDSLGRAASGVLGYSPVIAGLNFIRNRSAGVDDYSMAQKEAKAAQLDTGFALNSKRALRIGKERDYAETFQSEEVGFIMQNTYGKLKDLWGSNADAAAATAKAKESFERFAKFANTGDDMAKNGNFSGASEAYKAAAEEQELKSNWRNPMEVWAANQDSMKAAKLHAINQNPLPPLRRGQ